MATTKRKSKKGIIIGTIITLAVLALVFSPIIFTKKLAYIEETAKKGDIETYYTFSSNVESKSYQNVMAEGIMQISEIKVKEGQKVKKDVVLFKTSQGAEIKSKIAGVVTKIYIDEDESLMAGAPLCDIYDFDNLQLTVKVDEYDLGAVTVGKEVTTTISALDKSILGKISKISQTATVQQGVAYFTAIIDLTADEDVKVGMSAEAKILNKRVNGVLTIPVSVLQFDEDEKPFVFVKNEKGEMVKTALSVGLNDGNMVEVKEGLSENQKVYYVKETKNNNNASRRIMPPTQDR